MFESGNFPTWSADTTLVIPRLFFCVLIASIFVENLKTGVISDVNGFYTLPNLKPGTYTVKVTYVGYSPIEMKVTVPEGKTLE
jgi:hypothetical protein